jgi:hypothetical protein
VLGCIRDAFESKRPPNRKQKRLINRDNRFPALIDSRNKKYSTLTVLYDYSKIGRS